MNETPPLSELEPTHFSSELSLIIFIRPVGEETDWQEMDRGPGYFTLPADQEIRVRIKGINDEELGELVNDLRLVTMLRFLDLSENRNVTNEGLSKLKGLPQLTGLNLSSCSISNAGLSYLRALPHLAYLNLTYCNHLSDPALKILEAQKSLTFVDLKGCLGFTQRGFSLVRRRNLTFSR